MFNKIVIGQKIPIELHIIIYQKNATMLLGMPPPPSHTVTTRMNLRHFLGKGSPPSPSLSTVGLLMILLYTAAGRGAHTPCAKCNSSTFHPPYPKVKLYPACLIFVSSMPWNRSISCVFVKLLVKEALEFSINLNVHPGRLTWNIQISHLERKMILQTSMIIFHANLPRCTPSFPKTS